MTYFESNYSRLNYPIATEEVKGLRKAQLGAVHAIASHFTVNDEDSALIVMPTGSGKTAVINITPFLLRAKRVLVLSSSVMVRGQIVEEFRTLDTIKKSNVFHRDLVPPTVKEVRSPIRNTDEWESLKEFDVIVGIPNSINQGINNTFSPAEDFFDLILVDEAHHVPAFTWTNIVQHFTTAKKVFFTATPFRRDKKEIKGRLVYNYPISKAYEDRIFGDIGYFPVSSDLPQIDLAIAKRTQEIFNQDREAGLKHYLMVRTESTENATILDELYKSETTLRLKKVDSTMTYNGIKKTIKMLKDGELDGIICVDMLGEGFDFPNLKIAAIHSPKKSLSNTLQFIGRFARTNADDIGQAKFIAATSDIEIGKRKLYTEGAVWNDIVKNLSEETIDEEDEIKTVLDSFESEERSLKDISLYNLNPYCHVKVYQVDQIDLKATIEVNGKEIVYHSISEDYNVSFFILKETLKPKWMASKEIIDINYFFIMLFYHEETNLLFIHSSIRTYAFYDFLVKTFAPTGHQRISKYQLNKVLADLTETEFFNIGMQNRSANSGESYLTMAGSNAENAIRKSHGKNYANGHVFMKGRETDGTKITIGYSSGSKVWSNSYLKIPNYIKWCGTLAEKIVSNKEVKTNTGFDNLPVGQVVQQFPSRPHAAQWNGECFTEMPILKVLNGSDVIFEGRLIDLEIVIDKARTTPTSLVFSIPINTRSIVMKYSCSDFFEYIDNLGLEIKVTEIGDDVYLTEYLNEVPPTIYLDDFGALINHEYFSPPNETEFQFDAQRIRSGVWATSNTDVTKEFYQNAAEKIANGNRNSIHDTLQSSLLAVGNNVLIYDHGTGEVADFISVNETESKVEVNLFHVKGSGGQTPGDRVDDLYEVCMQSIKSTVWVTNRQTFMRKITTRVTGQPTKFLTGNFQEFERIMRVSKPFNFVFTVVQPGVSSATLTQKLSYLLAAADDHTSNSGYTFNVIGS
ncbi:MAG: DEAD/DEAH box helicase family protein [Cyclobacteriaceae bacterium]|nr:DEAD/DEAH box helicase family protein [Cyclobacteriaceae bacterium]